MAARVRVTGINTITAKLEGIKKRAKALDGRLGEVSASDIPTLTRTLGDHLLRGTPFVIPHDARLRQAALKQGAQVDHQQEDGENGRTLDELKPTGQASDE